MNTNGIAICILAAAMAIAGQVTTGSQFTGSTTSQLHALACDAPAAGNVRPPTLQDRRATTRAPAASDSPWNIKNLYDCETATLYIPYQLRTGGAWDGSRAGPCMRDAGTAIQGAAPWRNPQACASKAVWSWAKADDADLSYVARQEKGIGRSYDSRTGRSFNNATCHFPFGYGWELSVKRECGEKAVEITAIALNRRNELESIEFNTWNRTMPDHLYRYAVNTGLTDVRPH